MRILVICQYYFPEPFRITDICEELVRKGHQVTVVTGIPNYPMGEIYEDYKHGQHKEETINGVRVHRCFTIGRKKGPVYRFLNYYSYMLSSTSYISRIKEEYDVVFVNQLSPVMMANAGIRYQKKHQKNVLLYCLDLWPASLTLGGIREKSFIYRYFHKVSARIYQSVDKILVTSQSFKEYFALEFGMDSNEVAYLPQYAEDLFEVDRCKKEENGVIDLMFAGNIGTAQSVETIIYAAHMTEDVPNLNWHIVGDGSSLESCKKLAEKLKVNNVLFHGRKSVEEMPKYYSMADAMVITMQDKPMLSLTLPGKIQTYMAAGKAIIGAINGETQLVIKNAACGFVGAAEDAEELTKNVKKFLALNGTEKRKLGKNARAYYEENFTQDNFMNSLENWLKYIDVAQ